VTVAAITAGAIAGIVIAIIAFFAIAGGGAYAAAQAMGSGTSSPISPSLDCSHLIYLFRCRDCGRQQPALQV